MLRNSFREKEKEYIEQINNLSKRSNMLQQKKQQLQSQCKYMSDENHSLDGQVRKLRDDLQKYE
jgi:regulator of replication initiation timing